MTGTHKNRICFLLFSGVLLIWGIPPSFSQEPISAYERTAHGVASWYSESDPYVNLRTANGEIFDDSQFTCASWDYPFHTLLEVINLANNQSVICRVNDRGPAKRLNRLIDLTRGAFRQIANLHVGLINVQVIPLTADSIFDDTDR